MELCQKTPINETKAETGLRTSSGDEKKANGSLALQTDSNETYRNSHRKVSSKSGISSPPLMEIDSIGETKWARILAYLNEKINHSINKRGNVPGAASNTKREVLSRKIIS